MENFKKLIDLVEQLGDSLCGSEILKKYDSLIKSVFTENNIAYVDNPTFNLGENGNLNKEDDNCSVVHVQSVLLNVENFEYYTQDTHLYIYSFSRSNTDGIIIRFYRTCLNKKKITLIISDNIYEEFLNLVDTMAINKSKFVENKIVEFIKKNR